MPAVYDDIGIDYAPHRHAEPRWGARITAAIGERRRVINVGAGTGSYEPLDRFVIAAEPSQVMIAQRLAGSPPVVQCVAETLPFADGSFDVALALMTVHHWSDVERGLSELCRVAPCQIIFTWEPAMFARTMWFVAEYLPEVFQHESGLPTLSTILGCLGPAVVEPLPVPADCRDGVLGAYWRRPAAFLNPNVRAAISGIALLDQVVVDAAVSRLERDLASGAWSERHAHLLSLDEVDLGYRLIIAGAGPVPS
jgi:SAM-dependent methyltransferase